MVIILGCPIGTIIPEVRNTHPDVILVAVVNLVKDGHQD